MKKVCKTLNYIVILIMIWLASIPLMIGIKNDNIGLGMLGMFFILVLFIMDYDNNKENYTIC